MISKILIGVGFIVLTMCPEVAEAQDLNLPVVGVIDGDTIRTQITSLPSPLDRASVRINGIDTPEKSPRAKCEAEARLAASASAALTQIIGKSTMMTVTNYRWDKYGGRILGIVTIDGVNVGSALIAAGFAKPYDGGTKASWCD